MLSRLEGLRDITNGGDATRLTGDLPATLDPDS